MSILRLYYGISRPISCMYYMHVLYPAYTLYCSCKTYFSPNFNIQGAWTSELFFVDALMFLSMTIQQAVETCYASWLL